MRCAEHGLATGPDGLCVLCRRPSGRVEPVRRTPWLAVAVALIAAAALGSMVFTLFGRERTLVATPELGASQKATTGEAQLEPPPANSRLLGASDDVPQAEDEPDEPPPLAEPEPTPRAALSAPEASSRAEPPPPSRVVVDEQALRAEMQRVPITLYTTSWCPACEQARRWMRANAFTFVERDVERSSAARDSQRRLNPAGGVPTIDIDGRVLVGFSEQSAAQAIVTSAQRRLDQQR
jgi:glutaredoxin 3